MSLTDAAVSALGIFLILDGIAGLRWPDNRVLHRALLLWFAAAVGLLVALWIAWTSVIGISSLAGQTITPP